jgi:glycine/D-amino acid oxidase-like deaminating enzyme
MPDQAPLVIVGAGLAGLTVALHVADRMPVIVLAKRELTEAATAWAQGGIVGVLGSDDSIDSHVRDTQDAGAGLVDEATARFIAERSAQAVGWLVGQGRGFVHQASACVLRVADIAVDGVITAQHPDDATLRPGRGGLGQFALGKDDDRHAVRHVQGHGEAGEAGADDDEGGLVWHGAGLWEPARRGSFTFCGPDSMPTVATIAPKDCQNTAWEDQCKASASNWVGGCGWARRW